MILIETKTTWDEYLASLGKKARKNYHFAAKANVKVHYEQVAFDQSLVGHFMSLWEQQLIRGQHRQWAFPVEHFTGLAEHGKLMVFVGFEGIQPIALQCIQRRVGFWECHPVCYDKTKYADQYLSKWMWFNLIRFAINNHLDPLDFGGGLDDWPEMIRRRKEFPNPFYKWQYVPSSVKNNPDIQPHYIIENRNDERSLIQL